MDVVIRGLGMQFNCRFAVAGPAWIMLAPARIPRALAFPNVGECTVKAAHFVNALLDLVDR